MVKFIFTSLLVSACALGLAQDDIKLGDAKPIDIHVVDVTWQPAGKALIYRREQEKGLGLGVYSVNGYEGKVLIQMEKTDFFDTYWLANSNSALIVVRSAVPEAKVKSTQIKIYLVDADTKKATHLYSQTFDDKFLPNVEVNTSPSLKHAIVTMRNSEGSIHKVLLLGGALVDSPDLDRAEKEGNSGPNWSLDGTAIYSNAPRTGTFKTTKGEQLEIVGIDTKVAEQARKDGDTFSVTLTSVSGEGGAEKALVLKSFSIRFSPPMPPTGSTVLELMTGAPVLRPVRFRGPWVGSKAPVSKVIQQNQSLVLKFDQSNAQDTSVWLTQGKAKGAPATLVAVHANNTWMPDTKNGIVYVIDGALFFRSIGP